MSNTLLQILCFSFEPIRLFTGSRQNLNVFFIYADKVLSQLQYIKEFARAKLNFLATAAPGIRKMFEEPNLHFDKLTSSTIREKNFNCITLHISKSSLHSLVT